METIEAGVEGGFGETGLECLDMWEKDFYFPGWNVPAPGMLMSRVLGAPVSSPSQPALFTNLTADDGLLFAPSLGSAQRWDYYIPSTTLMLRIVGYPPHKIDRAALGRTILAAQGRIRTHITTDGDGDLWAEDDPFETTYHRTGLCFIGIASPSTTPAARSDVKLRYSTVNSVLQGLWYFMYRAGHEFEIIFKVEDKARQTRREGEELVGLGKVINA
ncbi:MAG: hypothetical protein Q9195_003520 [Heterodermia aff. obscurata]